MMSMNDISGKSRRLTISLFIPFESIVDPLDLFLQLLSQAAEPENIAEDSGPYDGQCHEKVDHAVHCSTSSNATVILSIRSALPARR